MTNAERDAEQKTMLLATCVLVAAKEAVRLGVTAESFLTVARKSFELSKEEKP